jgi:hypothetical protein
MELYGSQMHDETWQQLHTLRLDVTHNTYMHLSALTRLTTLHLKVARDAVFDVRGVSLLTQLTSLHLNGPMRLDDYDDDGLLQLTRLTELALVHEKKARYWSQLPLLQLHTLSLVAVSFKQKEPPLLALPSLTQLRSLRLSNLKDEWCQFLLKSTPHLHTLSLYLVDRSEDLNSLLRSVSSYKLPLHQLYLKHTDTFVYLCDDVMPVLTGLRELDLKSVSLNAICALRDTSRLLTNLTSLRLTGFDDYHAVAHHLSDHCLINGHSHACHKSTRTICLDHCPQHPLRSFISGQ